MSKVDVQKVEQSNERTLPIFGEVDRLMNEIRQRAFGRSRTRGAGSGSALDDWLAAERELCWPSAELVERERAFELAVALPGFEPGEVTVTATPHELIVRARHERTRESAPGQTTVWSEFRSNDVCRRIELPADIAVGDTTARLDKGLLKIVAGKRAAPARQVQVAAA